jgi:hypothetical protein
VIHLRVLAFDALDLAPVEGERVTFTVDDPQGASLARVEAVTSEYGVAYADVTLPQGAEAGAYALAASLGDTLSRRSVTVAPYQLPEFHVEVRAERDFYLPGSRVEGVVEADYFFPRPVAGGSVRVRAYAREPRVLLAEVEGLSDDDGRFPFAFALPPTYGAAELELVDVEVRVTDAAGRREGATEPLPVAPQPLLIRAVPEGGALSPGVPNTLFLATLYPDGAPAPAELLVTVQGEARSLTTDAFGLATLDFVPHGDTQVEVAAWDDEGNAAETTLTFPIEGGMRALLLRAERAVYEVGETLRAEVLASNAEGPVYLDVLRDGQMVAALSAPLEGGRAVFALDLDPELLGSLELHAYVLDAEGGVDVEDARWVVVDPARALAVDVRADAGVYRPGETAHLTVTTALTPTGERVPASLGLSVVDESVYALETEPPGFARLRLFLEEALLEGAPPPADLLDPGVEGETRAAHDVAARAAWAGAKAPPFTLTALAKPEPVVDVARGRLSLALASALVALPPLLALVAVRGLAPLGLLARALRRVGWGALAFVLAAPLLAGLSWVAGRFLGPLALLPLLVLVLPLLAFLLAHGWRRRDGRVQVAVSLAVAYLALAALVAWLGGDLPGALLVLLAPLFLLLIAALALLGQGLILEGRPWVGWAMTLLALLLVPLVVVGAALPRADSPLARALGDPAFHAGPVAWLTGCAGAPDEAPAVEESVESEAPMDEDVAEEPMEEPAEEPAPEGEEPRDEVLPTPVPTATAPVPPEPFPLRQLFPETLYWNPDARTGDDGAYAFDLPVADRVTSWRLTALASTLEGEVGVATYALPVYQDFFVDLEVAGEVRVGQPLTVTVVLYNDQPAAAEVEFLLEPEPWYRLVTFPPAVTVEAGGVATTTLSIVPQTAGSFPLRLRALAGEVGDAVRREVLVAP